MSHVKLTNKMKQVLPLCLKNGQGKLFARNLPPSGVRIIHVSEMSQDITDKESRGYLKVEFLTEESALSQ